MAEMAPEELRTHWDFLVGYTEKVKASGGDISKITPDDVRKNGEAGTAITQHAMQKCNLQAPPGQ